MEPELIASVVGQIAVVGLLFRWLHVQVRDNKQGVEKMIIATYSKTETKDLIDLKLAPITVGIAHVQEDLKEVKAMLSKLLDAKN